MNKALQSFHFLEEEENVHGGFSFGVVSYDSGGSLERKIDSPDETSDSDTDDEVHVQYICFAIYYGILVRKRLKRFCGNIVF